MKKNAGFSLVEVIIVIAFIIVVGLAGWLVYHRNHKTPSAQIQSTSATLSNIPAATPASATDNQSLNQDLSNINGTLSQNSQDLNSASNAINDQQHQISVPTN